MVNILFIYVTPRIVLDDQDLEFSAIRASGPGGQNVNKVSSAVQLRFDIRRCAKLSEPVQERLIRLAGRRVSQDGVLVITAQRFRSQPQNRDDAVARLVALIQAAAIVPLTRRPTKPTKASHHRRLDAKDQRATVKTLRRKPEE